MNKIFMIIQHIVHIIEVMQTKTVAEIQLIPRDLFKRVEQVCNSHFSVRIYVLLSYAMSPTYTLKPQIFYG